MASREPGWDKAAVNRIANEQYGGLQQLFDAHGWQVGDRVISQVQAQRAVEEYGSVEAFVRAHEDGRDLNPVLDPLAAIRSDPPQVFLKSFHGFTPETWGFLGYSTKSKRDRFIEMSKPGALVVICGTAKAPIAGERLRVLGMQQQSHIIGTKWDYLSPERHAEERADSYRADRWFYALKAIRAWRIPQEQRPYVRDIFPTTHKGGDNGTAIGSYGLRLAPDEARALLDLTLVEVPVFGGVPLDALLPGPATELPKPSRPGPVSQSGYTVREAEGEKHLYILRMDGHTESLLGYDSGDRSVFKVGFSVSPVTRCNAHNKALPACAFEWTIHRSTFDLGRPPFPSSRHALAGEQAMKDALVLQGKSLGGEFFLADEKSIERAWNAGIHAAENWKK